MSEAIIDFKRDTLNEAGLIAEPAEKLEGLMATDEQKQEALRRFRAECEAHYLLKGRISAEDAVRIAEKVAPWLKEENKA